jgi:hypothetical protein
MVGKITILEDDNSIADLELRILTYAADDTGAFQSEKVLIYKHDAYGHGHVLEV